MADGSPSRVLVTGGSGFIGRRVVRALLDEGSEVVVADRHPFPEGQVETVLGDLTDPEVVAAAVRPGTGTIIHLAAITSVLRSVQDPAADGYADTVPTWSVVESGVRAVISSPGGATIRGGSLQMIEGLRLAADPCDLQHDDQVQDETDATVYTVEWLHRATGYGLDHLSAGLRRVEGFA